MHINAQFADPKLEANYRVCLVFESRKTLFFIDRKIIDLVPDLLQGLRDLIINPLKTHTYSLRNINESDFCNWLSVLKNKKELEISFYPEDSTARLWSIHEKKRRREPVFIWEKFDWIQVSRSLTEFIKLLEEIPPKKWYLFEKTILSTASFLQVADLEHFVLHQCTGSLEKMIPDLLERYAENHQGNIEEVLLQLRDMRLKKFFVHFLQPPVYRNRWKNFLFPEKKKESALSASDHELQRFFHSHKLLHLNCFQESLRELEDLSHFSDEEIIYWMIEHFVSDLHLLLNEFHLLSSDQLYLQPSFMTDLLMLEQLTVFVLKKIKMEFNQHSMENKKIKHLFKDHLLLEQVVRSAKSIYVQHYGIEAMLVTEFVTSYLNLHIWKSVDQEEPHPPFLRCLEQCVELIGGKKEKKFIDLAVHAYFRKAVEMMDLQKKLEIDAELYRVEKDLMANLARDFPLHLVSEWGEDCNVYYNKIDLFSIKVQEFVRIEKDRKQFIKNLSFFFLRMKTTKFSPSF